MPRSITSLGGWSTDHQYILSTATSSSCRQHLIIPMWIFNRSTIWKNRILESNQLRRRAFLTFLNNLTIKRKYTSGYCGPGLPHYGEIKVMAMYRISSFAKSLCDSDLCYAEAGTMTVYTRVIY